MTPLLNRVWCAIRNHPTDTYGCSCGKVLTYTGWRKP